MTRQTSLPLKTAACAALLLSVVACSKTSDDATAGQKLDSAVASTERNASETRADVRQEMSELKQDMKQAGNAVAGAVDDASITAGVNAELAKDDKLSALKIDVDTKGGKVLLTGKAPDAESRERATRLAANVKGVTDVDNKLEVGS
ncbi:BON domain-containing protein [Uliginosibacterium paludis]|uniref:BON domain-containing protein n=1 Tax=Uliginosibacterium paludis TaxID=1615952 RepID=A0ABV2CWV7_9RHOO